MFANFAEAVAEGRGKAQAENLRRMRTMAHAKRLASANSTKFETVSALELKRGDLVLVEASDFIPSGADHDLGNPRRVCVNHSQNAI